MPRHWLHYLDASGLACLRSHEVRTCEVHFAASESGYRDFSLWLAKQRNAMHTLVVDTAEEDFHHESVPFVRGKDRRQLLERKLGQRFYDSPYATALSLGREAHGRRDEHLLLAGLPQPRLLEPWLAALRGNEQAVRAVHTPALLAAGLLPMLKDLPSPGLLLALSETGIRQIHYAEGKLRFSRLSAPGEGPPQRWGKACAAEALKTYQYIVAQHWIPRNAELPVTILLDPADEHAFRSSWHGPEYLPLRIQNIEDVRRRLRIHAHASSDVRPLFLALARRSKCSQLAPPQERLFYRLRQWKRRMLAAGAAGFALCTALALTDIDRARHLEEVAALANRQALDEGRRYQKLLEALPRSPAPFDVLEQVAGGIATAQRESPSPGETLLPLSLLVEAHPAVQLLTLSWHRQGHGKEGDRAAPVVTGEARLAGAASAREASSRLAEISASAPAGSSLHIASRVSTFSPDKMRAGADEHMNPVFSFEFRPTAHP